MALASVMKISLYLIVNYAMLRNARLFPNAILTRPGDRAVFGNTTRKNPTFKESVKQDLNRAIAAAPHQKSHATAQKAVLGVVNESVYVLADC